MTKERRELLNAILVAKELLRREAKVNYKTFVHYLKDDYSMQWFHSYICDRLQAFAEGKVKKMMILMPPQHGKTELSTRLLPPFLLGRNPDLKIAIATYASHIAGNFNRSIQLNIDTQAYADLFPDTKLNYSKIFGTNHDGYSRTTEKFDIVNKKGSVKTVGRGGPLTSEPVDIGIIDDLYKDREEASSMTISQSAWEWYVDVFRTRLHNDSQQLIMNTRWHEQDICGRLLDEEPGEWEVIKLQAIKTQDVLPYDPRKEGEALWEDRFSKATIMATKGLNEVTFNSLYQQDPKPNEEILIYKNWIEIPEWPKNIDTITWGLDFGKTTGINALVKCATVGMNAYFQECLYSPGCPVSVIIDALKENGYQEGEIVWCDHILTKINDLRLSRISAFEAVKGPGSVSAGIDKLKEYTVHYIGQNLRMEINNYQWVCYGKVITNVPVDDYNHLLDACRYGLLSKYFRGR